MKKVLFILFITMTISKNIAQINIKGDTLALPNILIDNEFGYKMDSHNNYSIIGCWQNLDKIKNYNPVYIYHKDSQGEWNLDQELTPSVKQWHSWFGYEVRIKNEYAVVAASHENSKSKTEQGSVYIFKKNSNNKWIEHQKLNGSIFEDATLFGITIDFDGFSLAISHLSKLKGKTIDRVVSIFEMGLDEKWVLKQSIKSDELSFGSSLAILENNLLIGCSSCNKKGSVHKYFKNKNSKWVKQFEIENKQLTEAESFGYRIRLEKDFALFQGNYSQLIGIYSRKGEDWSEGYDIDTLNLPSNEFIGEFDIFEDDIAVVSKIKYKPELDCVYVYSRKKNNTWKIDYKFQPKINSVYDWFGSSITINENGFLVGASGYDTKSSKDTGRVYSINYRN